MTDRVELLDSEILDIEKGPLAWAKSRYGKSMNMETFRRNLIDQFGEIGFRVDVKTYETNQPGTYSFDVEIIERLPGNKEFDLDQMVHEVTNDILDLGEGGVIKTDKGQLAALQDKDFRKYKREHGNHGDHC